MTTRIALDPFVTDLEGESARLREAGPLAAVELPGGVPVWAVTHHAEARKLLTDPRLVKDINVWGAWQRGEIAPDWPLIGLANPGRSMLTVDGADHRRMRTLVAQALTPRRVEQMRERIAKLTEGLLDGLPTDADVVDLKADFAYPLPMFVIADLMGIDESKLPASRSSSRSSSRLRRRRRRSSPRSRNSRASWPRRSRPSAPSPATT